MFKYMLCYISIVFLSSAVYAGNIMDKVYGWKDSISVGAISIGLIAFLVFNIRKLINEIKDVLEQVKIVSDKFKEDEDVKRLIAEVDEALEVAATIARRIGAAGLAKRLSDIIKK